MQANIATMTYLNMKKYGYFFFLLLVICPYLSAAVGHYFHIENTAAYFTLIFAFVIVPILDHIIGHDPYNPDMAEVEKLSEENFYRYITIGCVPLQAVTILFGGYYFAHADLNLLGYLGWMISIGIVSSSIGITVAHELIHKNPWIERLAGGLLLSSVCYATFKVEHVRGHHVQVGTEKDCTTAKFNQTLYQFLCKVLPGNFISGWRLEAERLKRKNLSPFSLYNELIWWYAISVLMAVGFTWAWGLPGLVFFLAQSFVAILVLEVINYVEHYGLARKPLGNGQYEPVNEGHSWNSDFLLSNLMLFQLQRHSDHHHKPKTRYQVLMHRESSPQLPSGYPTMLVLALFPPLWFKYINPLVPASNFHSKDA